MNTELNRDEVFKLFLYGLSKGKTFESAFKVAVSIAQAFDREMAKINPEKVETASTATASGGQFCPSGFSVYFLSYDGAKIWVGSFGSYGEAVRNAIRWNKALANAENPSGLAENNSGVEL